MGQIIHGLVHPPHGIEQAHRHEQGDGKANADQHTGQPPEIGKNAGHILVQHEYLPVCQPLHKAQRHPAAGPDQPHAVGLLRIIAQIAVRKVSVDGQAVLKQGEGNPPLCIVPAKAPCNQHPLLRPHPGKGVFKGRSDRIALVVAGAAGRLERTVQPDPPQREQPAIEHQQE